MNEKLIERLKFLANRDTVADKLLSEDSMIDDYAGGNVDDAFYAGEESGETSLARDILSDLGIEF